MYKTYVFCLVVSAIAISCNNSLKKDSGSNSDKQSSEEMLYKKALENSDYLTAIVAVNQILLKDTTRPQLYDSLAKYYIALQNDQAARKMVTRALEINPNNYNMLEYAAAFDQYDYKYPEAVKKLETCYKATGNLKYEYLLAGGYAQMQNYITADSLIDHIIAQPADKTSVKDDVPTPQNGTQKISLLARSYIMKAKLISAMAGDTKESRPMIAKYVNMAIQIEPDFQEALYLKQQNKL